MVENTSIKKCHIMSDGLTDSASKLETEPKEGTFVSYAFVVTPDVGTLANIPATKGVITGLVIIKHRILTIEKNERKY